MIVFKRQCDSKIFLIVAKDSQIVIVLTVPKDSGDNSNPTLL